MNNAALFKVSRRWVLEGTLVAAAICGGAQGSPSPQPEELVLTEKDNGTTATAVVTQNISLNLAGNPSTGFTWAMAITNGDSVVPTGDWTFTPSQPGGVGFMQGSSGAVFAGGDGWRSSTKPAYQR